MPSKSHAGVASCALANRAKPVNELVPADNYRYPRL